MGLFDKVKRSLNIGGAKIVLNPKQTALPNGGNLDVTVTLTGGKMDQAVNAVHIKLVQKDTWTERSLNGQSRRTWKEYTLAEKAESTPIALKAGEQKEFQFSLPVQAQFDQMAQQSGVMGALGKLNAMAQRQQHEWYVEATADIEGSMDTKARCGITVQPA